MFPDPPHRRRKPVEKVTGDLFGEPQPIPHSHDREAPYQPGSATSKAAARAITPRGAAMRENVRNAIIAAGERGITRRELEGVTGYLTQTLCARLNELEELRDIRKLTRLDIDNQEEVLRRQGCAIYVSARRGHAAAIRRGAA